MLHGGFFVHSVEAEKIEPKLAYFNKAENSTFRELFSLIKQGRLYTKVSGSLFRYSVIVTMQELSEHSLYVELKESDNESKISYASDDSKNSDPGTTTN